MKVCGDERKLGFMFSKAGCGGGQLRRNNLGMGFCRTIGFWGRESNGVIRLGFETQVGFSVTQFRITFKKKNASRPLKETRTQRHATLCKAWRSLANTRRHTHENLFDLSGDYSRKWNEWVEYSPWLPSEYVNGQNVPYCHRKSRSEWWPPRSWHTPEFQWRHSPDSPLTHPPHPPHPPQKNW